MNFDEAAVEATNQLQKCLIEWERENKKHWNESCCHTFTEELLNESDTKPFEDERLIPILEELFRKGADLNHLEKERGFSVVTHIYWSESLIKFFVVDRGMIDVNSTDQNGDTLLHLAIRYSMWAQQPMNDVKYNGHDNPAYDPVVVNLVKFLLDELLSADPNVPNLRGETPLFTLFKDGMISTRRFIGKYVFFTRIFANMLLEKGAKVATRNTDGQSILHLDIKGLEDVLIKYFDAGDIELRTSSWMYSKTPLMVATTYDNVYLCKLLIGKGAFVNATDLQGYTALHHAVLNYAHECVEFLVEMGADPKDKSASGMDVFDLIICPRKYDDYLVTCGATPTKQAEMYEISGAIEILQNRYKFYQNQLWENVIEICKDYDLKPSNEFVVNYEFLKQNKNNPGAKKEIDLSAINTVVRLSQGTLSKFWNLLSILSLVKLDFVELNSELLNLPVLSEELRIEDGLTSFEENHFKFLQNSVVNFHCWLMDLVELKTKEEATCDRISLFHSLVHLIVACFDKLKHETKSNKVSLIYMNTNIRICRALTLIHSRFGDVISEEAFNENKQLLRKLFDLDLIDAYNCDSLIHLILRDPRYIFETDLLLVLFDFDFVKVTTKNGMGFEPIQFINWNSNIHDKALKLFVKIADRGGHFDAKNVRDDEQPTLKEVFETLKSNYLLFRYDSLQCACARVLAKSLVPYRNRVPKKMVDFINQHVFR